MGIILFRITENKSSIVFEDKSISYLLINESYGDLVEFDDNCLASSLVKVRTSLKRSFTIDISFFSFDNLQACSH